MKTVLRSMLVFALLCTWLGSPGHAVAAISPSRCEPDGRQASGAVYRVCMPSLLPWNHELVVYAHGYVASNEPIAIPEDQLGLPGGPSIAEIINALGYAFATTSYATNGLAIQQGLADMVDLTHVFAAQHGEPRRIYIGGPSEGGIITALAVERHPEVFDGGLSACGPVGDFPNQINYWGDVRATFDYFFSSTLPGSAVAVPPEVIDQWESVYLPRLQQRLRAYPGQRAQWMAVAGIPQHPTSEDKTIDALTQLLWYSVFATNDGIAKLGGQPFDNSQRIYRGAKNDALLNYEIARFAADPAAVQEMQARYQTSGNLVHPLVTLHTTDPLIPLWHQGLYALKIARQQHESLVANLPFTGRYGHCNFTAAQVLLGFVLLVHKVTDTIPVNAAAALTTAEQRQEFDQLMDQYFTPAGPGAQGENLYLPALPAGGG
jgi:hypothetical protein